MVSSYKSYITKQKLPAFSKSALLVIDMQNYFSSFAFPIVENVCHLIKAYHKHKQPVIFTQHGHKKPEKDAGQLFEWWLDHIITGTKDHKIIDILPRTRNDYVIKKTRYSAFYKSDLEHVLIEEDITDLIITGVMTNLCCETTARDAFVKDYRVHFISDANATSDIELHNASLTNLAHGFAYIHESKELIQAMDNYYA